MGRMDKNCSECQKQFLYKTCSPQVLQKEELLTKIYLYSVSGQEMIRKLPDFLVNIYVSGSVSPGAELRLATEEFMKGSHRADEYIRR